MSYTVKTGVVHKDMFSNSWKQTTTVLFDSSNRQLQITTSKRGLYLITYAQAVTQEDRFVSHILFQDYTEQVFKSKWSRVTEARVAEQHAQLAQYIQEIVDRMEKFYKIKE